MSCWKSNVMWTPPTSDNPYVRRSHKKSTDEIIDDGILWTGQDHSNSISSQNLFTWCHMGIIHGKHMDIPLKKTKISPSIFWFCAGGFLNLGQYPNNWLTLITPPQRGWGKPHRIATCDVFHRLKISGRIFGRRNSWCYLCTWYLVYIYIYLLYVYLFWHIFWVHVLIHQPWNWGYCLSPIANWQPWEIIYLFISYLFGMCHRLTSTESLCRLATQHIQMVLHLCTSSLLP